MAGKRRLGFIGMVATFDAIFTGFTAAVTDLSAEDRRKLFHETAARLYRIPV